MSGVSIWGAASRICTIRRGHMSVAGAAVSVVQANVVLRRSEEFRDKLHNVEEDAALVAVVLGIGNMESERPMTRGRSAILLSAIAERFTLVSKPSELEARESTVKLNCTESPLVTNACSVVLVAVAVELKEVVPTDEALTVAHLVTVVVAVRVPEVKLVEVTELLAARCSQGRRR